MNSNSNNADPLTLTGRELKGRDTMYRVEGVLGSGGFGVVYRATYGRAGKAAIKVLNIPALRSGYSAAYRDEPTRVDTALVEEVAKFRREAMIVERLQANHVECREALVNVLDYWAEPEIGLATWIKKFVPGKGQPSMPWIAFDWIEGRELNDDIGPDGKASRPPRSPRACFSLMEPVLEALQRLHQEGIAHRDIKPSNFMVAGRGHAERLRLIDFGTVKQMLVPNLDPGGYTAGPAGQARAFTYEYGAPEQFGDEETGPWTDVYQMGLVATAMLTGRSPYNDPPAHAWNAKREEWDRHVLWAHYLWCAQHTNSSTPAKWGVATGPWEDVLTTALAVAPNRRFQNAGALLVALREHLDDAERVWLTARNDLVENLGAVAAGVATPSANIALDQPRTNAREHAVQVADDSRREASPWTKVSLQVHETPPVGWYGEKMPEGLRRAEEDEHIGERRYWHRDRAGGEVLMVYVREGEFIHGSLRPCDNNPSHRCYVSHPFYAGVFPVTCAEYRRFLVAAPWHAKHIASDDWRRSIDSGGRHPITSVSWSEAQEYCLWADARLLTEKEWEYAARGAIDMPENVAYPNGREFPWGDERPSKDDPMHDRVWARFRERGPDFSDTDSTAPVGERKAGASPFGLYDLSGNVYEWVEGVYGEEEELDYSGHTVAKLLDDCIRSEKNRQSRRVRERERSLSHGIARGGSMRSEWSSLRVANRVPFGDIRLSEVGFRIARWPIF